MRHQHAAARRQAANRCGVECQRDDRHAGGGDVVQFERGRRRQRHQQRRRLARRSRQHHRVGRDLFFHRDGTDHQGKAVLGTADRPYRRPRSYREPVGRGNAFDQPRKPTRHTRKHGPAGLVAATDKPIRQGRNGSLQRYVMCVPGIHATEQRIDEPVHDLGAEALSDQVADRHVTAQRRVRTQGRLSCNRCQGVVAEHLG